MPNEFEITGTVTRVGAVETFGAKGFRKREVIILTKPHAEWPEHVKIEMHGDMTDFTPRIGPINAKGWITGRLAADGRCWNTLKVKSFTQPDQLAPVEPKPKPAPVAASGETDDDLPF